MTEAPNYFDFVLARLASFWKELTRPASADFVGTEPQAAIKSVTDEDDAEKDRLGPDRHYTEYYLSMHL